MLTVSSFAQAEPPVGKKVAPSARVPIDEIDHLGILDKGVCFIGKPFSMKDLAKKVYEIIGQKFKNYNDGERIPNYRVMAKRL